MWIRIDDTCYNSNLFDKIEKYSYTDPQYKKDDPTAFLYGIHLWSTHEGLISTPMDEKDIDAILARLTDDC